MSKTARSCRAMRALQQRLAILPWLFEPCLVVRTNLFARHRYVRDFFNAAGL
jgi:hypothetical protein